MAGKGTQPVFSYFSPKLMIIPLYSPSSRPIQSQKITQTIASTKAMPPGHTN